MAAVLGRRRLFLLLPAAAVLCLTVLTFTYLVSPRHLRAPPILSSPSAASPSDNDTIPIPRQIWQIYFPPPGTTVLPKSAVYSTDWIALAPGYTYTVLTDASALSLIASSYPSRPELAAVFASLTNPALKSDLLRYLVLFAHGGIYTDMDTKPLVSPEAWLPDASRRPSVRLLVAPEYDFLRDGFSDQVAHPVQFSQWTVAAAPGHPVLGRMVERALAGLGPAVAPGGRGDGAFADGEVLNTTGPVAWTEELFAVLRERDETVRGYEDLAGTEHKGRARYFGDIAVLPLEAFRGDWRDDWGQWLDWRRGRRALVRHFFRGTWRAAKLPGQE